jgi:hypothetical protein
MNYRRRRYQNDIFEKKNFFGEKDSSKSFEQKLEKKHFCFGQKQQ